MTTEVDICNLAVSAMGSGGTGARSLITAVGAGNIADVTETSAAANQCKLWYPVTRDWLLRRHLWNFAREIAVLTRTRALPGTPENTASVASYTFDATLPTPPYKYEYAVPANMIRARYIVPVGQPIPPGSYDQYYTDARSPVKFEIVTRIEGSTQTKYIVTNERSANLVFTKRITNPDLWEPDFTMALVTELASRLSIPLSGDLRIKHINKQESTTDIAHARETDANEGLTEQIHPIPDWISARDA